MKAVGFTFVFLQLWPHGVPSSSVITILIVSGFILVTAFIQHSTAPSLCRGFALGTHSAHSALRNEMRLQDRPNR